MYEYEYLYFILRKFLTFYTHNQCVDNSILAQLNSPLDRKSIWPIKGHRSVVINQAGGSMTMDHDNNDIYYTSRVFIEKKKSDNIYKDKDVKMLKETILAQQRVIERMTKTIREDKIKIQKYENYIHKNK